MARLARVVIPGVAHHVTQRGTRRLPVFFNDDDRKAYLDYLKEGCEEAGVRCLAWCLMDNHVHHILIPPDPDSLRAALGNAHRRHVRRINRREGWNGFLFQGRFASYPMEDAHMMAAIRYVERNPVEAGLVKRAEDWRWSSAASHVAGKRTRDDPLTDIAALAEHIPDWQAMLRLGLEAGALDGDGLAIAETIEKRLRTGRLLGTEEWIAQQEKQFDRQFLPSRRGPKVRSLKPEPN